MNKGLKHLPFNNMYVFFIKLEFTNLDLILIPNKIKFLCKIADDFFFPRKKKYLHKSQFFQPVSQKKVRTQKLV